MIMSDIDAIKRKKFEQLLAAQQQAHEQTKQVEMAQAQLKAAMYQIMSKDAMQRLFTLRATRPEFAMQVELGLFELYGQGKLKPPVSDQQLKTILTQITQKNEFKIKRK